MDILIIAGVVLVIVLVSVIWLIGVGRKLQTAEHEKERADAFETEMERVGSANAARAAAERDARNGVLDDQWTRAD